MDITRVLHAGDSLPPLRAEIERSQSLSLPASRGHHSGSTCRGFSSPLESRNRERPSFVVTRLAWTRDSGSTCRGFSSPFESRNRERPSLSLPASRGHHPSDVHARRVTTNSVSLYFGSQRGKRIPFESEIERPEFVVTRLAWTSLGFNMQGIL